MDDQQYTNRFADLHSKIKTFKDRARVENQKDADLRESGLVPEFRGILDKEPD